MPAAARRIDGDAIAMRLTLRAFPHDEFRLKRHANVGRYARLDRLNENVDGDLR